MRPTGIIAQRIHLRAASADRVQEIRQRDICTVLLDQRCLTVTAPASVGAFFWAGTGIKGLLNYAA